MRVLKYSVEEVEAFGRAVRLDAGEASQVDCVMCGDEGTQAMVVVPDCGHVYHTLASGTTC